MSRRQGETPIRTGDRFGGLRRRLGYLLILAAMVLFTLKFGQAAWVDHQEALQVHAATGALRVQEHQINTLKREIKTAHSASFIVNHAREWGYVKRGELLVNIDYLSRTHAHRVTVPKPPVAPKPAWQQWWNSFTGP